MEFFGLGFLLIASLSHFVLLQCKFSFQQFPGRERFIVGLTAAKWLPDIMLLTEALLDREQREIERGRPQQSYIQDSRRSNFPVGREFFYFLDDQCFHVSHHLLFCGVV
jgi:hypothetical protein